MTRHRSQDERRDQILAAAKRCFIVRGFAHTRVDDIAVEAGLSKGGVYFHFRSKREIFDALHDLEFHRVLDAIAVSSRGDGSAMERLGSLASVLISDFAENEEHKRFLIVLGEMSMREAEVHRKVVLSHTRYVEAIAELIRAGVASGELRSVDAEAAALVLKLLIDGIEQGFAMGYPIDAARLMSTGLEIVMRGLGTRA